MAETETSCLVIIFMHLAASKHKRFSQRKFGMVGATRSHFCCLAVLLLTASYNANAFVSRVPVSIAATTSRNAGDLQRNSHLKMSQSTIPFQKSASRRTTKRQKSVSDRTPEEFRSLVQDLVKTAIDAGPQAGPARTLQAYRAAALTAREFLPRPGQPIENVSFPKVLRSLFEKMGATYIKLGQFIASSPTLFPNEYVVEFQKCLDQTDPLDWSVIEKVIVAELGPTSKNFEYIEKTPLASASIAQVHAAKLKTGEDVVLKVQKPGIDASLKADLGFVYVAARVLEFLQPDWERTSLSAVAGDIRTSMMEETDFLKEAQNTEEFRDFLFNFLLLTLSHYLRLSSTFCPQHV